MTLSNEDLIFTFMSVYPVSGKYAWMGERLGMAAVLKLIASELIEEVSPVEALLEIADKLESLDTCEWRTQSFTRAPDAL